MTHLVAALGFFVYMFSFRPNWLADKDVENVLSMCSATAHDPLEPSFRYVFNPQGSSRRRRRTAQCPLESYTQSRIGCVAAIISPFGKLNYQAHKDQMHLMAESAYSPGIEGSGG